MSWWATTASLHTAAQRFTMSAYGRAGHEPRRVGALSLPGSSGYTKARLLTVRRFLFAS
jgi:hypothetical protein